MRLFIAVKIDEKLKDKILEAQKGFAGLGEITFVEKGNLHLTLKFLGEVSDNTVNEISKRVKTVANKFTKFKISISGLSFFSSADLVKAIFIAVGEGKDKINEIEKELNQELKSFREEDFNSHPHITIGRVGHVKDKAKLIKKMDGLKNIFIGEMEIEEIILMESKLGAFGPVYSEIEKFELKRYSC